MYVILLGLPGAGKGTQAARLKDRTGLAHISSGDLFRENIGGGTELGLQAKEYVESGRLVPDQITIGMILERIAREDARNGFMLDGFPRNTEQARALDAALSDGDKQIDKALYIKVGMDELVSRLAGRWTCKECGSVFHEVNHPPKQAGVCDNCGSKLSQREDDKAEVVRTRLEVNVNNLEPLLDHYRSQGKLMEVDGQRDADAITKDMAQALESR